jgi:hypothetical protein
MAEMIKVLFDPNKLSYGYHFFLEGDEKEYVVTNLKYISCEEKKDTIIYYKEEGKTEIFSMLAGSKNVYMWGEPDPLEKLNGCKAFLHDKLIDIMDIRKEKNCSYTIKFKILDRQF